MGPTPLNSIRQLYLSPKSQTQATRTTFQQTGHTTHTLSKTNSQTRRPGVTLPQDSSFPDHPKRSTLECSPGIFITTHPQHAIMITIYPGQSPILYRRFQLKLGPGNPKCSGRGRCGLLRVHFLSTETTETRVVPQGHPIWGAGNPSSPNLALSLQT